ncbi:MAG: protein phosphatase 2C domain-containing protein, partial [Pedobacter sp.]
MAGMDYSWRHAYASAIGTSHISVDTECQDSSLCTVLGSFNGEQILLGVVSDGAGSAIYSQIGSAKACEYFVSEVTSHINSGKTVDEIDLAFIKQWLKSFQEIISEVASAANHQMRDYACTFLAVVASSHHTVFCQVGDGAIVVSTGNGVEEYDVIFWP